MITMTLHNSLGNPTKNFRIFTLLFHSQMIPMAVLVFFAEIPEWQWNYDYVLDSLYLTATSRMCLYIFFERSFSESVLSLMFEPKAPFDGVPLFMAHPAGAPLQPFPPASPETDPSEAGTSTCSSSSAPGDDRPSLGGLGAIGVMANGFLSFGSG